MFKKTIGVLLISAFFALSASFAEDASVKSTNTNIAVPLGTVVKELPADHTVLIVKKKTYYYHSNTYYVSKSGSYVVVASPFIAQSAPVPAPAPAPAAQPAPAAPPTVQTTTTVTTVPVYPAVVRVAPAPVVRNPDSQNPIKKFARGVFCVVFGFMEIPINMTEIARKEGPPQAMSYGFFKGVGFFILREVVGCVEIGTFIIPLPGTVENGERDWGYGPLLEPEWIFPVR